MGGEINDILINNKFYGIQTNLAVKVELNDLLQTGKLFISVIPDIESVNYGRGVGYDVIYHEPPTDIEKYYAMNVAQQIKDEYIKILS